MCFNGLIAEREPLQQIEYYMCRRLLFSIFLVKRQISTTYVVLIGDCVLSSTIIANLSSRK
jgi:hypothetical protein